MLKWNKSSFLQKLVAAWMRILLTFFISDVSGVLANIMSESSHCFRKGNIYSGHRLCILVCPRFWEDYYMLIHTHCWELMNSVGGHGSLSLLFVLKVMVFHFVSDSHEVMTVLIVMLPRIVVVEISLQLHQALYNNSGYCLVGLITEAIAEIENPKLHKVSDSQGIWAWGFASHCNKYTDAPSRLWGYLGIRGRRGVAYQLFHHLRDWPGGVGCQGTGVCDSTSHTTRLSWSSCCCSAYGYRGGFGKQWHWTRICNPKWFSGRPKSYRYSLALVFVSEIIWG